MRFVQLVERGVVRARQEGHIASSQTSNYKMGIERTQTSGNATQVEENGSGNRGFRGRTGQGSDAGIFPGGMG